MHRFTRSWITTVVAWVAVLFIGGAAIAGVGSHSANKGNHENAQVVEASDSPEASESPDVEESESPEAEVSDGEKADNHGQCVSTWAHKAKEGEEALEGRFFGGFVSAVAQTDDTGADCDESELLAEWQAKQAEADAEAEASDSQSSRHGKSGEEHGRPNTDETLGS